MFSLNQRLYNFSGQWELKKVLETQSWIHGDKRVHKYYYSLFITVSEFFRDN